jgi:Na+/proline symporter
VHWNRWDFALALLPFAVWILLMITNGTGKSLANLAEAMYLGCMAPLAPIVRVAVGDKANQRLMALGLLVGMCLVAISVWAFVPGLPE